MNNLELISRITLIAAESNGIRAGSHPIIETLVANLGGIYGFVCIENPDDERIEVAAACGLSAADFRRLESRVESSSIRAMISNALPMTIPIENDTSLDFLKKEHGSVDLASVPIFLNRRSAGAISIAFAAGSSIYDHSIEQLMVIAASITSQIVRNDRIEREESRKLLEENLNLRQELKERNEFGNLIGRSGPMRQVYDQMAQVARSNATVLLRGESGTGKELIANALHYNSLRSKRPFIKVNCAALPETLIESELFGYEPGAFTGANKRRLGRFEMADGGTLFLDEIGDLSPQTQIKLLRVLQEREFERLGGNGTVKVNVRLIAATNKDLESAIADGTFREDLFYRLNVFTIFLPPLRDRKSDILLLAEHFLEKYNLEHDKKVLRLSTPAIDMLTAYHYPGNIRELENAIERAVLVADGGVIHGHHLPPTLQTAEVSNTTNTLTLDAAVAAFESDMIQDALKSSKGNIAKAARQLDSTERILGYKIKKYEIDTIRFRR